MIQRNCPITRVGKPEDGHVFFGYYDKCPWSENGRRLLAHRTGFIDHFPGPQDTAEIGWFDLETDKGFRSLATTRAWNWQQGAQLQWIGRGERHRIIYNDRRDGRLVAVLLDEDGNEQNILDRPIYTVSPDGRYALSINYARLTQQRPEYGYAEPSPTTSNDLAPEDDGIDLIDLETGKSRRILSIAQAVAHRPNPMGEGRFHYFNHLMFNTDGSRFCFMQRFERTDGIHHSRLFTLDPQGVDLRLLFEGMVSHYAWRDEETLLAWAGRRKLLGGDTQKPSHLMTAARRVLKPIYYALGKPRMLMNKVLGDSYLLIKDEESAGTEPFARGHLIYDGHCSYSSDRRWVLTDGYPDQQSRQPLYLWDTSENAGYEIGRYKTPRELDGPIRVDLHPRFNRDATRACVDSAMDGQRGMYLIDVGRITQKNRE